MFVLVLVYFFAPGASHFYSSPSPSILVLLLTSSLVMEELTRNGISSSLPKGELIDALSKLHIVTLRSVRTAFFENTKSKGLCVSTAILVNRRDTAACPLSAKLSHDVWALMDCLRHNVNVPRSLLRNGKRDRSTFEASQVPTVDEHLLVSSMPRHIEPSIPPSQSCQQSSQVPSQLLVSRETFATSTVMRELNLLKNEVRDIKSALSSLSCTQGSDTTLRNEVANIIMLSILLSS